MYLFLMNIKIDSSIDKFLFDTILVVFSFLIGGNGKAYEGRGWWFQSDKSLQFSDYKGDRIDIAFIGNYGSKYTFEYLQRSTSERRRCSQLCLTHIEFNQYQHRSQYKVDSLIHFQRQLLFTVFITFLSIYCQSINGRSGTYNSYK